MKRFLQLLICVCVVFTLTSLPMIAQAASVQESAPHPDVYHGSDLLSPALRNLSSHVSVRVSSSAGEDALLVYDDFLRALNKRELSSITLKSLPPVSEGELTCRGNSLKAGDVLSSNDLSALSLSPAGTYITDTKFTFVDDSTLCEYTCRVFWLSSPNSYPITTTKSVGSSLATYEDISVHSKLPGYDPDGDSVEYIVVEYPKHGSILLDKACGEYEYIPEAGFTGNDSFRYVIADEYGGYGAAQTVNVSVDSVKADEMFADMSGSSSYAEAISLAREGVLGGRVVGGQLIFSPAAQISRGEFVSMLMSCSGTEIKNNVLHTVFYDDSDIHSSIKGAVAAAYELGYINGTEVGGKLYFHPNEIITRAECARIINNILGIIPPNDHAIPAGAGIEDCPESALPAVTSLCSASILPMSDGELNITLPLTREYAAKLLWNVKSFINS